MNNTEKLLRAFIEASGYDVETVKNFDSAAYNNIVKARSDYAGASIYPILPVFTDKADYTSTEYKVTKRVDSGRECLEKLKELRNHDNRYSW